jgi:hypothetical protein
MDSQIVVINSIPRKFRVLLSEVKIIDNMIMFFFLIIWLYYAHLTPINWCEKTAPSQVMWYFIYITTTTFFYNNYLNNPNFNIKSDKFEILRIRMAACHCQWRSINVPLSPFSFFFKLKLLTPVGKHHIHWRLSNFF